MMLDIKDILKISEEMGVEIRDGNSGIHYILDEQGREMEFDFNMLMKELKEGTASKISLYASTEYTDVEFKSDYELTICERLYLVKTADVLSSVTNAA